MNGRETFRHVCFCALTLNKHIICRKLCMGFQTCTRLLPSYIEMMCGWRRDDMISISLRMCTMSCSSLIFSFRIDLMATWKKTRKHFYGNFDLNFFLARQVQQLNPLIPVMSPATPTYHMPFDHISLTRKKQQHIYEH